MSVDRTRVSVENKQQKSEGCEDEKGCDFGGSRLYMKREAARPLRDSLGFTKGQARA
jgi:hypothetical protein